MAVEMSVSGKRVAMVGPEVLELPLPPGHPAYKMEWVMKAEKVNGTSADGTRVGSPPGTVVTLPVLIADKFDKWRRREDCEPNGNTSFSETWADVDHFLNAADLLKEAIEGSVLPDAARDAESDSLKKFCLLSGRTGWEHFTPEGITNVNETTIPSLPAVGRWLNPKIDSINEKELSYKVKKLTGHAWPTNAPTLDAIWNDFDLGVHGFLALKLDEYKGDLSAFEEYLFRSIPGRGPLPPVCAQLLFRTQGYAKGQFLYGLKGDASHTSESTGDRPVGGKITATQLTLGKWPRKRQVFSVPTFVNLFLRPFAVRVKHALWTDHSFRHTTPRATLRVLKKYFSDWYWFSEDLSGYDRSVSYLMQMDLLKHVYSRMTDKEKRAYEHMQNLSVLAPGISSPNGTGFMYERKGMTISGSIMTTNDGTLLNFSRIVSCLRSSIYGGRFTDEQILAEKDKKWTCLVLGDDCSIGLCPEWKRNFDMDRWDAANGEMGFTTTLLRGIVFLSTVYDLEKDTYYGLVSTALHNTFTREYACAGLTSEALGIYMRWNRVDRNPLHDVGWSAVRDHDAMERIAGQGQNSVRGMAPMINSPSFQKRIVEETENQMTRADMLHFLDSLAKGEEDLTKIAFFSELSDMTGIWDAWNSRTTDLSEVVEFGTSLTESDVFSYIEACTRGQKHKIVYNFKERIF